MKIDGSKLMSCGATADGGGVQLHLADAAGEPVTLILPLALARSVATVLPQLLTFALKSADWRR